MVTTLWVSANSAWSFLVLLLGWTQGKYLMHYFNGRPCFKLGNFRGNVTQYEAWKGAGIAEGAVPLHHLMTSWGLYGDRENSFPTPCPYLPSLLLESSQTFHLVNGPCLATFRAENGSGPGHCGKDGNFCSHHIHGPDEKGRKGVRASTTLSS